MSPDPLVSPRPGGTPMLRLRDPDTGALEPVPRRVGLVRMCVVGPARGHRAGADELRRLLTADLLRRVLEDLHQTQVLLVVLRADPRPADRGETGEGTLGRVLDALWFRPCSGFATTVGEAEQLLTGPIQLLVDGADTGIRGAPDGGSTRRLEVAPARSTSELPGGWEDPLAVRLALLASPYARPTVLTQRALADAAATLGRWRDLVVRWAGEPAAPMSHPVVDRVVTALDADLDLRAALDVVRAMESDASIASGAKLETLLYLDRTFGFNLVAHLAGGGTVSEARA
jgi:hypothetical protein